MFVVSVFCKFVISCFFFSHSNFIFLRNFYSQRCILFLKVGPQNFINITPQKKPGSAPAGAHCPLVKRSVLKAETSPPSRELVNE